MTHHSCHSGLSGEPCDATPSIATPASAPVTVPVPAPVTVTVPVPPDPTWPGTAPGSASASGAPPISERVSVYRRHRELCHPRDSPGPWSSDPPIGAFPSSRFESDRVSKSHRDGGSGDGGGGGGKELGVVRSCLGNPWE